MKHIPEPVRFCEDTALTLAERTFSSEVDEQLSEDIIRYARRLHTLYSAPQPAVQGELVGWVWHSYNQTNFTTGSHHKEVLEAEGIKLTPVYTAPKPAPDVAGLVEALESLIKGYVKLLQAGRDRITSLGGDCDPIHVMEQNDPWLRDARNALATCRNQGEDLDNH